MEALHAQFGGAMRAVALRVTRSDRLAEEVVQDSLMAVWRNPGRFDPNRGPLGPWLMTITRNNAIDGLRRAAVIQRHTEQVDLELRPATDDVHDEVWLAVRRDRLYEAIMRLGSDQRRALELAFISGLTHIEVAEHEGIPLGTAKGRIRLALLKLREHLAPSIGPDPSDVGRSDAASRAHLQRQERQLERDYEQRPEGRSEASRSEP
ncbi:MAG TPA: sigma-70 family RNA polymerase sigma factor [Candidatus Limnocylindria bacterium]|nr:sigma-70 family RNA polymerase sigma factor [Candidatus Limnocylindria bacterium]